MVFLTTGVTWLALMMQAERTRAGAVPPDAEWLLPADAETIEDDDVPPRLLAAE